MMKTLRIHIYIAFSAMLAFSALPDFNIACAEVLVNVSKDKSQVSIRAEDASLEDVLKSLHKNTGIKYKCPKSFLNKKFESNVSMRPLADALGVSFRQYNIAIVSEHGIIEEIHILNENNDPARAIKVSSGLRAPGTVSSGQDQKKAAKRKRPRKLIDEKLAKAMKERAARPLNPASSRPDRMHKNSARDKLRDEEKKRRDKAKLERLKQRLVEMKQRGLDTTRLEEKIKRKESGKKQKKSAPGAI